jgi:hypothetical protein
MYRIAHALLLLSATAHAESFSDRDLKFKGTVRAGGEPVRVLLEGRAAETLFSSLKDIKPEESNEDASSSHLVRTGPSIACYQYRKHGKIHKHVCEMTIDASGNAKAGL